MGVPAGVTQEEGNKGFSILALFLATPTDLCGFVLLWVDSVVMRPKYLLVIC